MSKLIGVELSSANTRKTSNTTTVIQGLLSKLMKNLLNILMFQGAWFALVLAGNHAALWLLPILAIHLLLQQRPLAELSLIAVASVIGIFADTLIFNLGGYQFTSNVQIEFLGIAIIPWWLMCLWLFFCATLRHSLAFLQQKKLLASILAATSGPLSYFAGMKLGAVSFGWSLPTVIAILALLWAILLPLFFWLSRYLDDKLAAPTVRTW
ncbi:DUF2878 domain-containing protein [Endozoicomonas sp. G2_1]|uniref:DUF2878 domain-containing protein n=1 Tax=Endozoicomonas sp. G2_1 TaxID=2821091 RepID=UPI001ADC9478|nr:DUF2878 domain-containing protein [Endozoicomonas sp. G2_1]